MNLDFQEVSQNTNAQRRIEVLREKCPNTEFSSGPYFAVFSPNTRKYGPEKTPYLNTFHAVWVPQTY